MSPGRLAAAVAALTGLAGLAGLPAPAAAEPAVAGRHVIVRLRAEGPAAVDECAEHLHRTGRSFASASASGSASLDDAMRAAGVRDVRALFRRPDGRSLAAQRAGLRAGSAASAGDLDLAHVYALSLRPGTSPETTAARLAADPHVVWAQADPIVEPTSLPDDPLLSSEGSWGQPYADLWNIHRVEAPAAWPVTRGEGVVVAVVDTGIDPDHPDLRDNLWINPGEDLDGDGAVDAADWNGVDDDGNGFVDDLWGFDFANSIDVDEDGDFVDPGDVGDPDPFDDGGHGTHIAGTIAARDNGIGVVGVAPRARLMAVKGFPGQGAAASSVLAQGIVYAARMGADVVSNSWSCRFRCPRNPVIEEAVRFAAARGVVLVFSAGNKIDDVQYYSPENLRETLVVGSTTERDRLSDFSSRGLLMDVVAPGSGSLIAGLRLPNRAILSTRSSGTLPGNDGGGAYVVDGQWMRWSGTSMATPHVAGAAALLLADRPGLGPEGVRAALRRGAADLGEPGHDARFGAGRLDAAAALALGPPDASARIRRPNGLSILDPRDGPVEVLGRVEGAVWELSLGRGFAPTTWIPLESGRRDSVDGVLHRLDVPSLADGGITLRVRAWTEDGEPVDEFAHASIERNRPTRISDPVLGAAEPAISGDTVVWHASLTPPGEDPEGEEQLRIFAAPFHRPERARAVTDREGQQRHPSLDGRLLVWGEGPEGAPALGSCRLRARKHCRERQLLAGQPRQPPLAAGRRVWWTERGVWSCEAGRRCTPERLAGPGDTDTLRIDGDRILWSEAGPGRRELWTCRPGEDRADCDPLRLATGRSFHFAPDLSGTLVAWEDSEFGGASLRYCRFDPDTGTCPSPSILPLAFTGGDPPRPRVEGGRILWQMRPPGEDPALFFCEVDRIDGDCPPQRLTGAGAVQRKADMDGHRLVWEDLREGTPRIYGIELPRLQPLDDRSAPAGRRFARRLRAVDPAGEAVAWSVSARGPDGRTGERMRIVGPRAARGTARLVWRPREADRGLWVVRITARFGGGLESSESFRLHVE